MTRILVVDDEPMLRAAMVALFRARGFEVHEADSGEAALKCYGQVRADAVVLDIVLPGLSGVETYGQLRIADPDAVCVFITAHGSIPAAVEAMRAGAYDYLTKPFDNDHLVLTVERAVERRGLTARVAQLEEDLSARSAFTGIIGSSPAIQDAIRRLGKAARTQVDVLLSGESGTGKELAARSLHRASSRSRGPFVAINCGAIPATLAEAELFGHERGAFTDAKQARRGRFEQAGGGTLFLDEVGELAPDVQVKLLRAVEEREVRRIGAEAPVHVDVRLIAATNRDLRGDVATGRFRGDLFWRLSTFQIDMPPLRNRGGDLPLLIDHLLDLINAEYQTAVAGVAPAVLDRLSSYGWPGNVRELANVLRHGAIMTAEPLITITDLPEYLQSALETPAGPGPAGSVEAARISAERRVIEAALEKFNGNRTAAAQALGVDRKTLYNKLRRYGRGTDPDPKPPR